MNQNLYRKTCNICQSTDSHTAAIQICTEIPVTYVKVLIVIQLQFKFAQKIPVTYVKVLSHTAAIQICTKIPVSYVKVLSHTAAIQICTKIPVTYVKVLIVKQLQFKFDVIIAYLQSNNQHLKKSYFYSYCGHLG